MFSVIGGILAIGFLIIVHEAGHYFVARWCGMRVDRFSIGFGPPILKWRRGDTDFTIGPIPFGGFVLINGMTAADDYDPNDPQQYPNKPVWQRFAAIFAGPATNYLTAIVLAFGLFAIAGVSTKVDYVGVGALAEGASVQGVLQPDDRILKVNGEPLYWRNKDQEVKPLSAYVSESEGKEMSFTVLRNGEELQVTAAPAIDDFACTPLTLKSAESTSWCHFGHPPDPRYMLGIIMQPVPEPRQSVGIFTAAKHALVYPIVQTKVIGKGLYDIVTGRVKGELSGPVYMAQMAKRQIDAGWVPLVLFLMLLNVYVGLFNLLPLPALDGGRLMFLGYEMTTRRRANPKVEATVHMVGIMALLLIMVLVTYKDIGNLL